ncbi:S-adenosyl-L-methionine-dependent methyltransferase [Tricladium varicosporioides]|nr:S-adenosyl-L-methionine-dependent methyltransferase [Hymenoscyphus varicosporioides]
MNISELITTINEVAGSNGDITGAERAQLLVASEKLYLSLEGPREKGMRIVFSPHQSVALRIAIDMKIFDVVSTLTAKDGEFELEELTSKLDADPLLVVRIMRFLTAISFFHEVAPRKFKSTPFASAWVTASPLAQATIHMTSQNETITSLPSYLARTRYQNPSNAYDGPFQAFHKTNLHCFDWLATQPPLQHAFNVSMGIARSTKSQKWFEYFPVESKLSGCSPDETLVVDIGGGVGHDLIAFKQSFPEMKGKLVLQETSVVVKNITNLPEGIEAQEDDMFASNPVKGAKAYYLANVLHDWPDKEALQILGHVKDAMNDNSVVLVNENVLPEMGVGLMSVSADFVMMGNFASLERTEVQFKDLFEKVGLEFVKSWDLEGGDLSEGRKLLEARLKR